GFPPDAELEPGMSFAVETEGGLMPLWIVDVGDDEVLVDVNHPLAGAELHFSVNISEVRQATAEELEHGHVHGEDGHHDRSENREPSAAALAHYTTRPFGAAELVSARGGAATFLGS